jgi:hypothetical protein
MPSRSDLREYYNIGAQLAPMVHQHDDWPYEIGHPQYVAYMVPPHDVGGQADVPVVARHDGWPASDTRMAGRCASPRWPD